MDADIAIVTEFWDRLERGRLEEALKLVGDSGRWRPLTGGADIEGRAAMRTYLEELRAAGGDLTGHAYAVERRGRHVVVHGVVRYSAPGRFVDAQGHWVHRVRDGAIASCLGFATAREAEAAVAVGG
jgi:ketosteroid isomerase-like protein